MTYTTKFMSAFAIVTLLALLTACRDEADDVIQPGILTADKSLTEQFDAIWHGINQNYVFWEADPTDWDAVYSQYRPRFVELDKQEAVPTADLQKLYEEICGSFIDHHMLVQLRNVKAGPAALLCPTRRNGGEETGRLPGVYPPRRLPGIS